MSRQRGYLADATGAELSRPRVAFRGCARSSATPQGVPLDVNPATASLYIVNLLRRQGIATLFSTQPPLAERVRRLRELDGDETFRRVA